MPPFSSYWTALPFPTPPPCTPLMPIPAKDDKVVIPDLPEHWDLGGEIHPIQVPRNLTLFIHQLLCFMGLGYANLQTVWEKSHTSAWRTTRKDMMGRLQHVNLMVRQPSESFVGVDSLILHRTAYCSRQFLHSVPQLLQRIRGYFHITRRFHTVS